MLLSKKIAKSGSVTLPRSMRQETGIHPGVPVDIETRGDGTVTIRKRVPSCFHCGSVDDVAKVSGIEICRNCAEKIWEAFNGEK